MKKILILCLLMMGVVSCADKGPVAPKEGRQSVGVVWKEPALSSGTVRTEKSVAVKTWAFADKTATNKKPHVLITNNALPAETVSVGKGIDDDNRTVAGPVVWGNVIYTLDSRFTLQATNLETKKSMWRKSLGNITGTTAKSVGLAIYHQKLYAVAGNGLVVATDLAGNPLWQRDLKTPLRSSPIADNNRVFVSSIHNQLFVLNAENGKDLWHYDGEQSVTNFFGMGSPAVKGNVVIMPTTSGRVNAFEARTGRILWSQDMWQNKTYNPVLDIPHMTAAPVIDGETVYLVGNAGKTGLYRLTDGMPVFTVGIGGRETPTLSGNALFILSNKKEIMALHKKDGTLFWKVALNAVNDKDNEAVWYGPLLINQSVLAVSSLGDIVFYNAETGKEERRDKQAELAGAPIAVGETILILTQNGDLLFYQ